MLNNSIIPRSRQPQFTGHLFFARSYHSSGRRIVIRLAQGRNERFLDTQEFKGCTDNTQQKYSVEIPTLKYNVLGSSPQPEGGSHDKFESQWILPIPHLAYRPPENFLRCQIPAEIRDDICSQLPGGIYDPLADFASDIPDPLTSSPLNLPTTVDFELPYRFWHEWRDRIWIELILIEHWAYLADQTKNVSWKKRCIQTLELLHQLSLRISYYLGSLERLAATANPPFLRRLEEIASKRHLTYGVNHPWALIRPYLNPIKLGAYYDAYAGLSCMSPLDSEKEERAVQIKFDDH